ncbi:GNAT family N-acetyltransferase [Sphingobacterium sp. SG20118]|uniref:GNAT family N-acetyltransferase n=1 Tax=Sphingobacterium TaxID=28453 RepID=UPI0004F90DF3|nr:MULTISPECIES: GNAT family N-acetyltransferase [Sphingobacterium]AIM36765.1 GNAT family acetyltransferase [Sphingobacterium sp. ML3W]MDH5827082.1 GNAT family N-acetyltransferase [Sphingobacterium faecium]
MTIKNIEDEKKGQIVAEIDGKEAGVMGYTWAGEDKFIIDHTEVHPGFEGNGVGKKLVLEAVDYARKKNVKIMPLCPFAKSVFDRTEAFQDVLF